MSITITDQPVATISGITSNVIAGNSQFLFKFKRTDAVSSSVQNNGSGKVKIVIAKDGIIDNAVVGDIFNLSFATVYTEKGNFTTTAVTDTGANMEIEFDSITYLSNASCDINYITLITNYRLLVNLYNNDTNQNFFASPFGYTTLDNGELSIDLTGAFNDQYTETYNNLKLTYSETYNDATHSTGQSSDITVINAYKHPIKNGGVNMYQYLLNDQEAQPFTKLERSAYDSQYVQIKVETVGSSYTVSSYLSIDFKEYKGDYEILDIDTISASEHYITFDAKIITEYENNSGLGNVFKPAGNWLNFKSEYDYSDVLGKTLYFIIDDDSFTRLSTASIEVQKEVYDSSDTLLTTQTETFTTTGLKEIEIGYYENASYWKVNIYAVGSPDVLVSKEITLNNTCIKKQPIIIEWKNKLGVLEDYIFSVNQNIDTLSEGETIFEGYIDEYQPSTVSNYNRQVTGARQEVLLRADNISKTDQKYLRMIKLSPEVNMYLNLDKTKKISTPVINDFVSSIQTGNGRGDFNLIVSVPKNLLIDE